MEAINPIIFIGSIINFIFGEDIYKFNAYSPKRIKQTNKSKYWISKTTSGGSSKIKAIVIKNIY